MHMSKKKKKNKQQAFFLLNSLGRQPSIPESRSKLLATTPFSLPLIVIM